MVSLSTSVKENKYCQARCDIDGSICQKCYANTMFEYRKTMNDKYKINTEVLTSTIMPVESWPIINAAFIRLEAFGDLNNDIQVVNYFNLCKANPHAMFALWTKNPHLIDKAISNGNEKPKNLVIILSSLFINRKSEVRYSFVDKIFTVYDKESAKLNKVKINCGARNCLTCGRCYRNTKDVEYVNELLK